MQLFRTTQENEVNVDFSGCVFVESKRSSINFVVGSNFYCSLGLEEVEAICQDYLNSRTQSEKFDELRNIAIASQSESSSIPPTVEDQSHLQAHSPQTIHRMQKQRTRRPICKDDRPSIVVGRVEIEGSGFPDEWMETPCFGRLKSRLLRWIGLRARFSFVILHCSPMRFPFLYSINATWTSFSLIQIMNVIQGVQKKMTLECCWNHGAQAKSPVAGNPFVWKNVFWSFVTRGRVQKNKMEMFNKH